MVFEVSTRLIEIWLALVMPDNQNSAEACTGKPVPAPPWRNSMIVPELLPMHSEVQACAVKVVQLVPVACVEAVPLPPDAVMALIGNGAVSDESVAVPSAP